MPSEDDEDLEHRPSADLRRYVKRAWLVLSACWVAYVFFRMLVEPDLTRLLMDRPLRVLAAVTGMMLAPPVIVYGAGLAVWFAAKWLWRKIGARRSS